MFRPYYHFIARVHAFALAVTLTTAPGRASDFTWEINPQNTNWNNALNWAGPANQVPDDNRDTATVAGQNSLDPELTTNQTLGALAIQAGGVMFTGDGASNFSLLVQNNGGQSGSVAIDGQGTGFFTALYVEQSPSVLDLDTDSLFLRNSGNLFLRDGSRVQVDQQFSTVSGGAIVGHGLLEFGGNSSNDGRLQAVGGTLTIRRTGNAELDLDGAFGDGRLYASPNATLVIDSPLSDPLFNGTIELLSNTELRINPAWELASSANAQLDFNATSGAATLSGTGVTLSGVVNVNSGTAVLAAPTTVTNTAAITIAEGATLQFDAPTTIDDADSIANQFNTTLVINDLVYLGMGLGHFDWDGPGQNGLVQATTIVNPGGFLGIQVESVDEPGLDERVSADLILNDGSAAVDTADNQWEMAGTLTMRASSINNFGTLSGRDDEVLITGQVNIPQDSGTSTLHTHSIFAGSSQVDVASGGQLVIGGIGADVDTTINGGTWTGAGLVSLDVETATVTSATTVNMPNGSFDLDGEFPGGAVVLNAPLTLHVASVERILDDGVDVPLQINSSGRLDVRLTNPNQAYTIDSNLDLNGLGGGLASLHLAGSPVVLAGTTDVSGNSSATARVDLAGTMNIAAGGTFVIRGGTEANPSVVRAGANVLGPGNLVVSSSGPGYLRLNDAAGVGADLINQGHLEVGSSPGHAAVASFTQSASGTYEVEIDGLTPSLQYDQLLVAGVANLEGTLEVLVNDHGGAYVDPMMPGTFDQFTLILAADVNGSFDQFSYDGVPLAVTFAGANMDRFHVGGGLFRILDYDAAQMDLLNYRALPGDANGDGTVDGLDFIVWNSHKFTCGTDWVTGDFDGDGCSDGSDFILWNSNKFTNINLGRPAAGSNPASISAVPEPAGLAWMSLSVLFLAGLRQKWQTRQVQPSELAPRMSRGVAAPRSEGVGSNTDRHETC